MERSQKVGGATRQASVTCHDFKCAHGAVGPAAKIFVVLDQKEYRQIMPGLGAQECDL